MSETMISRRWTTLPLLLLAVAMANGCAAVTNPISSGIPVRYLPKEVLGRPKKDLVPIPLTLLKLKEQSEYRLDKGDILAVVAGDMFGPENIQAPVSINNPAEGTQAAVGYPLPVREDGTISLPNAIYKPIMVKGMTAVEVEAKLRRILIQGEDTEDATGKKTLLYTEKSKISVQLQRKRRYTVTVVRDDIQSNQQTAGGGILVTTNRRQGVQVSLESGKNDVLTALALSGGPPGSDAKNEITIERGQFDPANPRKIYSTIPLSLYADQPLNITQQDITLNEGDILIVPNRSTELYMVGGIINPRQVSLPKDYDLDVVQAVIVAQGPIINGATNATAFNGNQIGNGIGNPSPRLINILRQLPDGQQINIRVDLFLALKDPRENILIMPNDRIIMQEIPADAVLRWFYNTAIKLNYTYNIFGANSPPTTGNLTGGVFN